MSQAQQRDERFVRPEILSSWRESMAAGLRPGDVVRHFEGTGDPPAELLGAGLPVADRLGADLRGTDISVLLSDADACVVARNTPSDEQRDQLDALSLSPGYCWSISAAGTTALGIASSSHCPVMVDAAEHFTDAMSVMTTASAPIFDPRTGQLVGALTLVCPAASTNALLLLVARRAAREVEHRLLDGGSARERLLDEHFLRARRGARAPLVVVGERTILMNAAASRVLTNEDQPRLWALAEQAIKVGGRDTPTFVSSDGSPLAATVEIVRDGGDVAGAILRLRPKGVKADDTGTERRHLRPPRRPTYGWASLTETERFLAELIADGLTNKQAAARLFVSRHTIDSHLRHIFRKLDINSRVDLARLVAVQNAQPADAHVHA
jgi:DNA-binding CsgD family transcriptional regulator